MTKSVDIAPYWDFPYEPHENQIIAFDWAVANQDKKYLILESPVGCHTPDTPLLLHNGEVKMVNELGVGDMLMGPDGMPRNIHTVYSGTSDMYQITPVNGEPFVVNGDHVLSLMTTKTNHCGFDGLTVINLTVNEYLDKSNDFKNDVNLYRCSLLEFDELTAPAVDPYMLGLLIGNSTCDGNNKTQTTNSLIAAVTDIGLYGKRPQDMFIPHMYKTSSSQQRLNLLAGLLDTNGALDTNFFVYFTKSKQLADDVAFVVRSLGMAAYVYHRNTNGQKYYDVKISGDVDLIPTKLHQKQTSQRKQKECVTITGFRVDAVGMGEYMGFGVDGDHLYVMGDFTVTHNSGKSNIGLTYANYINGKSFILTPQKILQEQYEDSFRPIKAIDLASFYGRSNYNCKPKGTNCSIGGLVKPRCKDCPYNNARDIAANSDNTVMNYSLAIGVWAYTDLFADDGVPMKRDLLILDEAHTLERHLVDFDALAITEWRCTKYDVKWRTQSTLKAAVKYMEDVYLPGMRKAVEKLTYDTEYSRDKPPSDLTSKELKALQELANLEEHVYEQAAVYTGAALPELEQNFVLVNDPKQFMFKRLSGAYSFNGIVEPMANQFLFMSSTIMSMEGFCADIGIDPNDAAFLSLGSEFDPENRPVYYMPQMKMNYKWQDNTNRKARKDMLANVQQLCEIHNGESGIIHTGNFKIAEWLVENLNISQQIFHHNPDSGDDRTAVIKAFMGSPKPGVLISPSCTEGLDLKGDLGRFAIFAKVPYGFLGDQWIKARMEMSNEWYQRQAIIDMIQGGGRVVRGMDDHGYVYILDASFSYLMSNTHNQIPQWWKDAYHVI